MIISVCGAGGKTTFIEEQSKKLSNNCDVLVTTTTKMAVPDVKNYDYIVVSKKDLDENREYFLKNNIDIKLDFFDFDDYTILRNKISSNRKYDIYYFFQEVSIDDKNQKFMHIKEESIRELKDRFGYIFIEADGSRRLKLKYPKENEPVITKYTDRYVYVFDMTNIGERLKRENVYNFEDFEKNIPIKEGEKITENLIDELIEKNAAFKNAVGQKVLLLNKVRDVKEADTIQRMIKTKYSDIEVIKKEYIVRY